MLQQEIEIIKEEESNVDFGFEDNNILSDILKYVISESNRINISKEYVTQILNIFSEKIKTLKTENIIFDCNMVTFKEKEDYRIQIVLKSIDRFYIFHIKNNYYSIDTYRIEDIVYNKERYNTFYEKFELELNLNKSVVDDCIIYVYFDDPIKMTNFNFFLK